MREIFHKAERVLIWLGEISAQSRLARLESELKPLGYELTDLIFINEPLRQTVSADEQETRDRAADDLLLHIEVSDALRTHIMNWDRANAIVELVVILISNYWRRVWIVQEIVLASTTVEMVSGVLTISFETLVMIEQSFGSYFHYQVIIAGERIALYSELHLVSFFTARENIRQGQCKWQESICGMLQKFGRQGSTDPRDRVYALIGMTMWDQKFDIDYNCHILELYVKALRCIAKEQDDVKPGVVIPMRIARPGDYIYERDFPSIYISHILRLTRGLGMNKEQLSALLGDSTVPPVDGLTTDSIPLRIEVSWYYIRTISSGEDPSTSASWKSTPVDLNRSEDYERADACGIMEYLLPRTVPDPSIVFKCRLIYYTSIAVRYDESGHCSIYFASTEDLPLNMPQDLTDLVTSKLGKDTSFWERLQARGYGEIRCHCTPLEILKMLKFDASAAGDVDPEKLYNGY